VIARLAGNSIGAAGAFATAARLRRLVLQLAVAARNSGRPLGPSLAARVLAESLPATRAVVRQTIAAVGKQFGLTAAELKGQSRQQAVVEARGIAMYLVRHLTGASYGEIGKQFGSRDHTTVLHACRKVARLATHDDNSRLLLQSLANQLSTEGAN